MKIGSVIITKDDLNIFQEHTELGMAKLLRYKLELKTCIKQSSLDILYNTIRYELPNLNENWI